MGNVESRTLHVEPSAYCELAASCDVGVVSSNKLKHETWGRHGILSDKSRFNPTLLHDQSILTPSHLRLEDVANDLLTWLHSSVPKKLKKLKMLKKPKKVKEHRAAAVSTPVPSMG